MSKVLIGVGGSGQHVVHAYLRMLAAANCRPQDVPHIYIVDADASVAMAASGDSQLCANICKLHRALVRPLAKENRSHFALVRPYFQANSEATPGKAQDNLDLNRCPDYLREIFLTDESSDSLGGAGDRTVDLLQGMMANAKVGAMAFGYKLMQCAESGPLAAVNFGYRDSDDGASYNLLKDIQKANVAIVGSSFGGTGSGVIPALVRYLADINVNGPRMVRAFMTLPWFEIESADGTSAAATQGNSDPKARNSALGLRTYLAELDTRLNKSNYVVAQFPGNAAKREDRGNYNQGEDPHVFNLVLACSIQSFLWADKDCGGIDGDPEKRKLMGLVTSREEEQAGQFSAAHSAHMRFRVKANDNRALQDIVLDAEVVALALEKGAEYIQQFKVEGADSRKEPSALVELAKLIATSYDKKPLIKKGIPGLRTERAPDEVYRSLRDALTEMATILRQTLLWVDNHKVTEDREQGVLFPNVTHLFKQDKSRDFVPASEEDLQSRWKPYGLSVKSKEMKGQALKDSTPRIGQAFTLFLNCFFGDTNLSQELRSLADNQPDAPIYSVAAQMLASLIYAEVIEARAATRQTEKCEDLQDEAAPTGHTTAFFKKVKLDITIDSSRTCVIGKGSLDAELGDVGSDSFQSPLHDKHPLSVRHLDPYIGVFASRTVDLGSVTRLARGEGYFPELALKGIPNVAAPLLLQDWRLARGTASPKADPLIVTPGVRDLRLSDAGLFQHAARIVEAGFWLLFTQDPKVELIELETADDIQQGGFVRLLNRELKSYRERTNRGAGANNLPSKVIAFKRAHSRAPLKPILIQDDKCGWYLAANSDARRFLSEIFGELPSVRYGRTPLDAAWRGQEGKGPFKPEPGSFEFNMTRAFARYLGELCKSGGTASDTGWVKALTFVRGVLADAALDQQDDETVLVPTGKTVGLLMADGRTVEMGVKTPKALLAISKDLFVEDPVFFFNGDETAKFAWAGIWPLHGSAWEFLQVPDVDAERRRCPMQLRLVKPSDLGTGERSAWHVTSIELNLRELGKRTVSNPFSTGGGGPKLVPGSSERNEVLPWVAPIWPNFQAPGWEYYIAGGWWDGGPKKLDDFDLHGNSLRIDEIEWRIYGEIFASPSEAAQEALPRFGLIGTVSKCMPVKLTGKPRAVEIVMDGRVMGSMPVALHDLPETAQSRSCDLAIDFGTSNTCLALKMTGDSKPRHLPTLPGEQSLNGKPLPQFTIALRPFGGESDSSNALDQIWQTPRTPWFFFQSFSTRDSDNIPRSIPSELINLRTGDIKGQQAHLEKSQDQHAEQFAIGGQNGDLTRRPSFMQQAVVTPFLTPMPPRPGGIKIEDLAVFIKGGLFRDFKWPGDVHHESGSNEAFRAVYLEQLLAAACASLRWMGIRSVKRLVATYPGAFDDGYRDRYISHLNQISKDVFRRTGISVTDPRNVIAKSETVSALASAKPTSSAICVTIDMGGGTTDVGVIVPNMLPGRKPFSYMASVRYAGNDLLKALLSVPTLRASLGSGDEDDNRRLDKLKFMIRAGDGQLADPAVANVAQAFFEGLFEYVFSLVAAVSAEESFPKDEPIRVHLFGNGFKLTNVFLNRNASDFLASIKRDAGASGLLSEDVASRLVYKEGEGDAKLALIQGAITGAVDKTDIEESGLDELLREIESLGHNRVAIWYPCMVKDGAKIASIKLGTANDRSRILDLSDMFRNNVDLDLRDKDALKRSFPLTSKYWNQQSDAVDHIFGGVPKKNYIALGAYYLQGRDGVDSSFASVVLPSIGRNSKAHRVQHDV
jgi:hypothetical protein